MADRFGRHDADAFPPRPRRIGAALGFALLAMLAVSLPAYTPPMLLLSGHVVAATVGALVLAPLLAFLGALAFAPRPLQRVLSRFTAIRLEDGGHVAAAVVMALTLYFALGLQISGGIAAVEAVAGPPPDFEPPPTAAAEGAPPAPNVTVERVAAGAFLNWSAPSESDASAADAYRVYRGLDDDTVTFHARVENATNYTDTRAVGGFAYVYVVTALNASAESAGSEAVSLLVPIDSALLYGGLVENVIIFVLPVLFYVSFVHGVGPTEAFRRLGFRRERLGVALAAGAGVVILFMVATQLVAMGIQQFQELPENERAQAIGLGVGLSGAFFLALASSVSEEVLFRGFLQPRIGIWAQAVIFSLAHISYVDVVEVVVTFALALVFGLLYARTKNLWAPIAAHFVFNFLSVIAIVCTGDPAQCGLPPP